MSTLSKISLVLSALIMSIYFSIQSLLVFNYIDYTESLGRFEYGCFVLFVPLFSIVVREFIIKNKRSIKLNIYSKKLNDVLVKQSHNRLFYSRNLSEAAKELTKEVTQSINVERCSVWLYNRDKTSIVCQQLYIKSEYTWYQGSELFEKDFRPYFDSLKNNPVIVANNAETHPSTSCFSEVYLKPLGIKSMLDVPILFKGDVIGVICIESLVKKEWCEFEINFSKLLSSLYTFSYSVKENATELKRKEFDIRDRMNAINQSNIVIEFDINGYVKFANQNFCDSMGYKMEEIVGKHHNLFVEKSFFESKDYGIFWEKLKEGKFESSEFKRIKKDGSEVWLQATYNPIFNSEGNVLRIMKIATDITDKVLQSMEIEKKNTYLEHAAKIIRHDMHSGINTYIPRGISSLERRLSDEDIKNLKIEAPLKMIKEGLRHTQKVYKGVYEFTNLVKKDAALNKDEIDLKYILDDYLSSTAYKSQVDISNLGKFSVNEALFCTAIDNLIRNGLKYNDSNNKSVKISRIGNIIYVEDNGRGLTSEEFKTLSKPYTRKEGQKETGTGLGLNICISILKEHGFTVDCEKRLEGGSRIKIKLY